MLIGEMVHSRVGLTPRVLLHRGNSLAARTLQRDKFSVAEAAVVVLDRLQLRLVLYNNSNSYGA